MAQLTIGEVAQRAGLRTSAIRYYESVNLLPPAQRTSGQRRYDENIIERLTFIQTAQELGFSLSEIKILFDDLPEHTPLNKRWQQLAHQKLYEVKKLIQQAQTMQQLLEKSLDCRCLNIYECMGCVVSNCHE